MVPRGKERNGLRQQKGLLQRALRISAPRSTLALERLGTRKRMVMFPKLSLYSCITLIVICPRYSSFVAASPLYQSFNVFLRQNLLSLLPPSPPVKDVHIIIVVRKVNPNKRNHHATGRYIRNLAALIDGLRSIEGVKVTAQDFAEISFLEQIQLAHTGKGILTGYLAEYVTKVASSVAFCHIYYCAY